MGDFAELLKEARAEKGYRSARAFYQWLKECGISFNYSYYMQLEQGALPSEKVVGEIGSTLKGRWADKLTLAYCRSLFPKQAYLFKDDLKRMEKTELQAEQGSSISAPTPQKELTIKQISTLARSELHYHLFLLSTLARKPITIDEIKNIISQKGISNALKDLLDEGIIRQSKEGIEALSIEARFPEAYNEDLKDAYRKFDSWDETFGAAFGLELMLNKMLIRRVSFRYVSLIRKQLETLFDLVRTSDEVDVRFNDKVLQLKVVLRQGNLPG